MAERLGLAPLVSLQPQYNLLAREIEWEVVPAAIANGLGLLPWSPLGGGWLTGKYTREERPTGATRLGENPERGVEAYDRAALSSAPGTSSTLSAPWQRRAGSRWPRSPWPGSWTAPA